MKSEGSLAHSQVPASRTYPEPRQFKSTHYLMIF